MRTHDADAVLQHVRRAAGLRGGAVRGVRRPLPGLALSAATRRCARGLVLRPPAPGGCRPAGRRRRVAPERRAAGRARLPGVARAPGSRRDPHARGHRRVRSAHVDAQRPVGLRVDVASERPRAGPRGPRAAPRRLRSGQRARPARRRPDRPARRGPAARADPRRRRRRAAGGLRPRPALAARGQGAHPGQGGARPAHRRPADREADRDPARAGTPDPPRDPAGLADHGPADPLRHPHPPRAARPRRRLDRRQHPQRPQPPARPTG